MPNQLDKLLAFVQPVWYQPGSDPTYDSAAQQARKEPVIVENPPEIIALDGPLKSLEANSKYQTATLLRYPLNVGTDAAYPHYIKFNINIPEKSKFAKEKQQLLSGDISTADKLRAADSARQISSGNSITGSNIADLGIGVIGGAAAGLKTAEKVAEGLLQGSAAGAAVAGLEGIVGAIGATAALASLDLRRKTKQLKQTIHLYVPDTVQQTIVNSYDAVSMTEALGLQGFAAQGAAAVGGTVTDLANRLQGVGRGGAGGDERFAPVASEAIGKGAEISGQFGAGIKEAVLFSAGYAQNPQIEILYKATQNREFQFDFKFTPTSKQEAEEVLSIIKAFKFYAAPEIAPTAAGRFFVPPAEFDIQFMYNNQENKSLHKISTCVLEGIDVNYVTAGQFATYKDGMPIEIAMQLRFKEVEIIHKGRVEQGY